MNQPTSSRLPRGALALGVATLGFAAVATAQQSAPWLVGTAPAPAEGDRGAPVLAIRGTAGPATTGSQPAQRLRPRPARRSRPAAKAVVQVPTRPLLVPPSLAPVVQPPLTGLPDAQLPPALRRRRIVEEDPYGQLGIRSGGMRFLPWIQQDLGYDSNPNRTSVPEGSRMLRSEAGLRIQSDWLAHELAGELRGAYNVYPDVQGADRPEGSGRLGLRIDVSRDTALNFDGRFLIDTQRPGSPELNVPVRDRPIFGTYGVGAGVTQRFNRLEITLRGTIDHTFYEDARLANGTTLSQRDREFTQYGAQLRIAYELTPGVKPFVEGLADTRVYDERIDSAGFRRSSDAVGARLGSTFELTRLLTGELSAGYQRRRYDDPRLRDLSGPLVDAALVWSATPLTTVRLKGQTTLDESTITGASGAITRRATLEVQHDLRRNLSVIGSLTAGETDYKGISLREEFLGGALKLDYRLTRWLAFRGSISHERLKSTSPGSDYRATTYLVGLRLQP